MKMRPSTEGVKDVVQDSVIPDSAPFFPSPSPITINNAALPLVPFNNVSAHPLTLFQSLNPFLIVPLPSLFLPLLLISHLLLFNSISSFTLSLFFFLPLTFFMLASTSSLFLLSLSFPTFFFFFTSFLHSHYHSFFHYHCLLQLIHSPFAPSVCTGLW